MSPLQARQFIRATEAVQDQGADANERTLPGLRTNNRHRTWLLLWYQLRKLCLRYPHKYKHIFGLVAAHRIFFPRPPFFLVDGHQCCYTCMSSAAADATIKNDLDLLFYPLQLKLDEWRHSETRKSK